MSFIDDLRSLRGDGRGIVLLAIAGGWFLTIGTRMVYPVLLPQLRVAFDLDLSSAGLLITALFMAYALAQLPSGILADRLGSTETMASSAVLSAVALSVVVAAGSTPALFAATVLFGFGTGIYGVARFTAVAEVYPDLVGTSIGVVQAASDLGQTVLPPLAGFLTAALAWQFGFGAMIPLFALAAVAIWLTVPRSSSDAGTAVDAIDLDTLRYVFAELRRPRIVHATVILVLGISILQSFTGFYPTYLIEVKGLSPPTASLLFGTFFALGVVLKPVVGGAYDWAGVRQSLLVVIAVSVVALAAVPFAEGFWPVVAVTALVSSILGYGTLALSHLTDVLPDDMRGTGLGVLRTIYWGISSASPALFGLAADRGYFDEGFLVMAAVAVVMVVPTLLLKPD